MAKRSGTLNLVQFMLSRWREEHLKLASGLVLPNSNMTVARGQLFTLHTWLDAKNEIGEYDIAFSTTAGFTLPPRTRMHAEFEPRRAMHLEVRNRHIFL